jgi:hypothetical protein
MFDAIVDPSPIAQHHDLDYRIDQPLKESDPKSPRGRAPNWVWANDIGPNYIRMDFFNLRFSPIYPQPGWSAGNLGLSGSSFAPVRISEFPSA